MAPVSGTLLFIQIKEHLKWQYHVLIDEMMMTVGAWLDHCCITYTPTIYTASRERKRKNMTSTTTKMSETLYGPTHMPLEHKDQQLPRHWAQVPISKYPPVWCTLYCTQVLHTGHILMIIAQPQYIYVGQYEQRLVNDYSQGISTTPWDKNILGTLCIHCKQKKARMTKQWPGTKE